MLNLDLIAVGKLKEPWLREGLGEYAKRMEAYCRFRLFEVEEFRLPDRPSEAEIARALTEEGKRILSRVGKSRCVTLCVEGKQLSSEELSGFLVKSQQETSGICFVIGSSHGLSDAVKRRADLQLSVSRMTFPHQLFRLILAEQLYRALSIASGGKYHK